MTFSKDVDQFAINFIAESEEVMRGVVIKLSNAVVDDTPVDTGRLRGNWQTGDTFQVLPTKDKNGDRVKARNTKKILEKKKWNKFVLVNNLPYAETIEFGSRNRKAYAMLRLNVGRFNILLEEEGKRLNDL